MSKSGRSKRVKMGGPQAGDWTVDFDFGSKDRPVFDQQTVF